MKTTFKLCIALSAVALSCAPTKRNDLSKAQTEQLRRENEAQNHLIESYKAQIKSMSELSQINSLAQAKDKQFIEFMENKINNSDEIQVEKSKEFEFLNGKLPKTFYERNFYKGLSATTYDLFTLPGKIVKKKDNGAYQILTPIQLIKAGTVLENDYIEDGLIFKDYVTKGMSVNGSYVIGSFEAKNNQVVEITLTDVLKSFPKQEILDVERLKKYQEEIRTKEDNNQYYFIQSATLTIGTGRIFNSSSFKKDVNSIYLTVSGKVYKTDERIKNERIVTVELIQLKDMLL